jgi:hypothetical protein
MANGEDQKQIQFFFTPIVVPQGDGSFVVKPGKPTVGRKKLLIAAAADRAGVSEDTIRRLLDAGMLEGEQPSPRKTFVYEDSLEKHLAASRDREFWEGKNRQLYIDSIQAAEGAEEA